MAPPSVTQNDSRKKKKMNSTTATLWSNEVKIVSKLINVKLNMTVA